MIASSGTCTVTATQAADTNYQSASASEYVTAAQANSSLSVASGTNPSNYGEAVTFTATITSNTGMVRGRNQTRRNASVEANAVGGTVTWSSERRLVRRRS